MVLEVVEHPAPGTWVVVSGFGARAQWFRNVEADPRVRVQVGSRQPVAALEERSGELPMMTLGAVVGPDGHHGASDAPPVQRGAALLDAPLLHEVLTATHVLSRCRSEHG